MSLITLKKILLALWDREFAFAKLKLESKQLLYIYLNNLISLL